MNKPARILSLFVFFAYLGMFLTVSGTIAYANDTAKTATILFTSDLHANFLPIRVEADGSYTKLGGYARLKSLVDAIKASKPDALLLDAGDFSMGTLFQTIFATHAPDLRIMGRMGYDVTTIGNHEFDFRWDGLASCLHAAAASNETLPCIVASNYRFPDRTTGSLEQLKTAFEDYPVKDYTVIERGGCRIGIFGLMGKAAASNAPMSGIVFEDAAGNARRVIKLLREQECVDLVICLSHSGLHEDGSQSEDEILAKEAPGIDIIISGHTHTKLDTPIIVGKTIIGACGEYSEYLGFLDIIRNEDGGWRVAEYMLCAIDDRLSEDTDITEMIGGYKEAVQEKYLDRYGLGFDQVLAYSSFDFTPFSKFGKTLAEEPLGNLITDSYIYAVKKAEGDKYEAVTAAILPAGIVRNTLFEGGVTVADVFGVNPLGVGPDGSSGYPLISVYLTGKEIKTACEVDASVSPMMPDAQLYMSGVSYVVNPNRLIFNKVIETALQFSDGTRGLIEDKKLYRVVADLYSAQMLSVVGKKSFGLLSIVPKTKDGGTVTNFDEQIIYDRVSGTDNELKAWTATAEYLRSFDTLNGMPCIPDTYSQPLGRKVICDDANILAVLKDPNHIAVAVYVIVVAMLGTISFIVYRLTTRRKRKAAKNTVNNQGQDQDIET